MKTIKIRAINRKNPGNVKATLPDVAALQASYDNLAHMVEGVDGMPYSEVVEVEKSVDSFKVQVNGAKSALLSLYHNGYLYQDKLNAVNAMMRGLSSMQDKIADRLAALEAEDEFDLQQFGDKMAALGEKNNRLSTVMTKIMDMDKSEFDPEKSIRLMQSIVKLGMEARIIGQQCPAPLMPEKLACANVERNAKDMGRDLMARFEDIVSNDVEAVSDDESCDDPQRSPDMLRIRELEARVEKVEADVDRVLGFSDTRFSAKLATGLMDYLNSLVENAESLNADGEENGDEDMVEKAEEFTARLLAKKAPLRERIIKSI